MVAVSNSDVKNEVVRAYFENLVVGKLPGVANKTPGLLIVGYTGTGKSTSVYEAAEEIAELLGKRLFVFGKDKLDLDIDELAVKYKQMYDKIKKVVGPITSADDWREEYSEIIAGIIKDTFMDMTIDDLFDFLDALSTKEEKVSNEILELQYQRRAIIEKMASGEVTDDDLEKLEELEQKIRKIRQESKSKIFVLVDFDLNQVESVDMTGVIIKTSLGFRYLPPLWALLLKIHGGILFLDEFTNVESNEKRSIAYRIVLDKKIGEVFLDNKTMIVAAGNTSEDSSIAGELPYPLLNRFGVIEVTGIDKMGTINYLLKKYGNSKAALKVISFLAASSDTVLFNLPKGDTKETLKPFETPRAWEFVINRLMALNGDIEPDSLETRMLLKLYNLKPGDLVENAQGNMDIMNLVERVASRYVSESTAKTLATHWIEKVISPEELFKNPKMFKELYGRNKNEISMAGLQAAFMYAQWMATNMAREIEQVYEKYKGKRKGKIIVEIKQKVLPKYFEPLKVMGEISMEYVTYVTGLMAMSDVKVRGSLIYTYYVIGLTQTPELYQQSLEKTLTKLLMNV